MRVAHFCRVIGLPRSTWYHWRHAHLTGKTIGHWPSPIVGTLLQPVAAVAAEYEAWGHRKLWAVLRRRGVHASQSSVKRALKAQGLLQTRQHHAERRNLADARKAAFATRPNRRNRVWQMDFSEFETLAGGTWQICGIIDYATKFVLAVHANGTQTAADATRTIAAALEEAAAVLDLPDLEDEFVDLDTGEIQPLTIVTDNGPAFKSSTFASFIAVRPWLRHVRTRHRSPQTNGVIERTFGTAKYEYLFGRDAESGFDLHQQLQDWRQIFNHERPHEAIDDWLPHEAYVCDPVRYAENYALRVQKP
jgi:transposase InsO family protein